MYSSEKNIGVQHLCAKVKNLKYRRIGAGAFMRYYRVTMATQTRQNSIFLRLLHVVGDYKILETLLIFCHDITTKFDSRKISHATTIKESSTQCNKT